MVNATLGGAGGIGIVNPITGSTAGQYDSGTGSYYLAGGGAGQGNSGTVVLGGKGGGGRNIPGGGYDTNGTANTGGGGGGRGGDPPGSGGSGVVVVRYSDGNAPASATTGNPTVIVTGGYRIYQWTTSGSITF